MKFLILVAIALTASAYFISNSVTAKERFTLECDQYDKPELYLACENARANRDLADTVMRIEKKLPDFSKF